MCWWGPNVGSVPEPLRATTRILRRASVLRLLAAAALCAALIATAAPAAAARQVHYRGHVVHVPRGWPVYRIADDPSRCVRLDRHAVYLGTPSDNQRCPAHAVGRRRAIVI